jgi:hypothetical protein
MESRNGREPQGNRIAALRRFAVAITILNVLGHTVLGFEQSWAQPFVALATAYSLELILEVAASWSEQRPPKFLGGWLRVVDFLLPAHISALAVSMLLYANEHLAPIAFASAVAIGSKTLIRVPIGAAHRHCLNPSNTGIATTLLLFPWVGIAPPYQFTEHLDGVGDWFLPLVIVVSGTFLNTQFTGRLPLILGWLGGFVIQAVLRSQLQGTPLSAALLPMTGMAFLLFTFYMVPDPGTTPSSTLGQFEFGAAVASVYGLLMVAHVVFGLFFALVIVCIARGIALYLGTILAGMVRTLEWRPWRWVAPVPGPAWWEVVER